MLVLFDEVSGSTGHPRLGQGDQGRDGGLPHQSQQRCPNGPRTAAAWLQPPVVR